MGIDTRDADLHDAIDLVEQLTTALRTRAAIACAKGILMERYGLEPDEAFDLLARGAQTRDDMYRVAERIVAGEHLDDVRAPRPRSSS